MSGRRHHVIHVSPPKGRVLECDSKEHMMRALRDYEEATDMGHATPVVCMLQGSIDLRAIDPRRAVSATARWVDLGPFAHGTIDDCAAPTRSELMAIGARAGMRFMRCRFTTRMFAYQATPPTH